MKFNLEELNKERERNFKERLEFIKRWAEYIKSHDDKDWSKQQNIVINSQFE